MINYNLSKFCFARTCFYTAAILLGVMEIVWQVQTEQLFWFRIVLLTANHVSGPNSSSNPMTTKSPAKNVETSSPSRPRPILMSLLIAPFIGRRYYSRGGKNGRLIAIILAVVFACLLWLLYVMTFDFSLASTRAHADSPYVVNSFVGNSPLYDFS